VWFAAREFNVQIRFRSAGRQARRRDRQSSQQERPCSTICRYLSESNMKLLIAGLCVLCLLPPATAAELKIDLGHSQTTWQTETLLKRSDVRTINLPDDVAFHRPMRYRAVPLTNLLEGLNASDHLQFVASDGFAAEIPAALLLNKHGSTAWLAIEDPAHPWPALPGHGHGRAAPFYVVWTQPQAAHIGPEQWPYQLASIRKLADVAARFPALQPDRSLPASSAERRGFVVFQHTCLPCHTLNGQGDARLGPDLNLPHNPTEYLRADLLRAFIRDPQSLRRWPQAKMPGFDRNALSDADLDAVLAYLRHMAGRKTTP
jgi:mono/diheme cytochrome c family protein